jgi:uncharacterized lipoprotein YmbA
VKEVRTLAIVLLGVLLTACTATLPTRFYTLEPARLEAPVQGAGPILGLGPVLLPAYLDRPDIVTREGAHGLRLGELDKWAEPLQPMFVDLLGERLQRATGAREVIEVPSRRESEPRHAIGVEVDRFDADETGKVVLDARWRVYRPADGRQIATGREVISEEAGPIAPAGFSDVNDYEPVVAAMSRAVDALAQKLSTVVPGGEAARRPRS